MLKIRGLYYITHVANLASILKRGILSHKLVLEEDLKPVTIYNEEIVQRRKQIEVVNNRTLWDFANLYFQPKNAMLYRLVFASHLSFDDLVILGVDPQILRRRDIWITDGNAAHKASNKYDSQTARKHLKRIRQETDRGWWSPYDGSKRTMMAEVLVPDRVMPEDIKEVYVGTEKAENKVRQLLEGLNKTLHVIREPVLFFQPVREVQVSENLSLVEGDMFFSRMQTLTISVNTVGSWERVLRRE